MQRNYQHKVCVNSRRHIDDWSGVKQRTSEEHPAFRLSRYRIFLQVRTNLEKSKRSSFTTNQALVLSCMVRKTCRTSVTPALLGNLFSVQNNQVVKFSLDKAILSLEYEHKSESIPVLSAELGCYRNCSYIVFALNPLNYCLSKGE